MHSKRRPSGRDCALAQATLAIIDAREKREREARQPTIFGRDQRLNGVRLINLERRARFAQLAS
jgi:hypothetical protein